MANSNGIITAPVSLEYDVAPILGESNYSLSHLNGNSHGKIDVWSPRKPIAHNPNFNHENDPYQPFPDEVFENPNKSGWEIIKVSAPSGANANYVNNLLYKQPTPPYRLYDWHKYNKNAIGPKLVIPIASEYTSTANAYQQTGESVAKGKLKITFPTLCPAWIASSPPSDGAIYDNDYTPRIDIVWRGGSYGSRKVLKTINFNGMAASTYNSNYAGKTIEYDFTQDFNLPKPGAKTTSTFFLEMNSSHYINGIVYSAACVTERQWYRDENNEDLWINAEFTQTNTTNYDLRVVTLKRLDGRSASEALKIRIRGLWWAATQSSVMINIGGALAVTLPHPSSATASDASFTNIATNTNAAINNYSITANNQTLSRPCWDINLTVMSKPWDATINFQGNRLA